MRLVEVVGREGIFCIDEVERIENINTLYKIIIKSDCSQY